MTLWLRIALGNLAGLSRPALLWCFDAAGCAVVVVLLPEVGGG